MDFRKKYYTILGIDHRASPEEIRAAYRSLVKQYHPDRNPSAEAAEKIKDINEAYEILSSPEKRKIYDTYNEQEEALKQEKAFDRSETKTTIKKRTYERRYTTQKTEKLFIWGRIFIRFYADSVDTLESLTEKNYAIYPTNTEALIYKNGISREPLSAYAGRFDKAVPLQTNLRQPVLCHMEGEEETWYKLDLQDIRILDPKLTNVVKHDSQSFGTLEAELFAYVFKITEEEQVDRVTECYGETGRTETKLEGGWHWKRTEYYQPDCSTYWSDWIRISPQHTNPAGFTHQPRSATTSTSFETRERPHDKVNLATRTGCVNWLWLPVLIFFIATIPQLILPLLVVAALWLLIRLGQGLLARGSTIFSLIFLGFVAAAIFAGLKYNYTDRSAPRRQTVHEENLPKRVNVWKIHESTDSLVASENEELVSHLIRWASYDSTPYQVVLSVKVPDIRSAEQFHTGFQLSSERNAWKEIFTRMEANDSKGLNEVYASFDSIRQVNGLNERQLANMLVSCIQSVPYYLVTSTDCQTAAYNDAFVRDYLKSCNQDCCVGNAKFGIRSPLEFMSDLKGDCDTRALFLYVLLKHFNYDVALMTSEHYRHAAIAVHFRDELPINGSVMRINGKNYYPWETTNKGFQVGALPGQVNDLSYWNIVLVNER